MNELDRAILDDLILLFFELSVDTNFREFHLENKGDAFPENEICDDIREVQRPDSCGCCHFTEFKNANYIQE